MYILYILFYITMEFLNCPFVVCIILLRWTNNIIDPIEETDYESKAQYWLRRIWLSSLK